MDRILIILKKENGPRVSSAPALGLNTILFKHVYWYMQQISGERLQDHWSTGIHLKDIYLLIPLTKNQTAPPGPVHFGEVHRHIIHSKFLYPPAKRSFRGVYCFKSVRNSVIPSFRDSVIPSTF